MAPAIYIYIFLNFRVRWCGRFAFEGLSRAEKGCLGLGHPAEKDLKEVNPKR